MTSVLFWPLLTLLIAFYFLLASGGWLVKSLSALSSQLGVSEYLTSFILMSFATTLPEFLVGLNAALSGSPELALGNSFGSNIVNLGLILGLTALLSGRVNVKSEVRFFDAWSTFILGIAPVIMLLDGVLTRLDGLLLLLLFFMYLAKLISGRHFITTNSRLTQPSVHPLKSLSRFRSFFYYFGLFLVGSLVLILSSYAVVWSVESLALIFGLSEFLLGVFLLAFGTSLPELVFALKSAWSCHPSLSVGNLIGATAFNSTWIVGLIAVLQPIYLYSLNPVNFLITALSMVVILFMAHLFIRTQGYIGRRSGLVLISLYFLFILASFTIN